VKGQTATSEDTPINFYPLDTFLEERGDLSLAQAVHQLLGSVMR